MSMESPFLGVTGVTQVVHRSIEPPPRLNSTCHRSPRRISTPSRRSTSNTPKPSASQAANSSGV